MKLVFTIEQVDRYRDRVHRRTPRYAIGSAKQALDFVDSVGFAFAFKSDFGELPCLMHAAAGSRSPRIPEERPVDETVSFVWQMKEELPARRKVYYGRLLKHRPTMVSLEYLSFFYALSGRTGARDEHRTVRARDTLSPVAREILEALRDLSPQPTKGLKLATGLDGRSDRPAFDRAMTELQEKMYIAKIAEEHAPFSFVWAPFRNCFPDQVRKARRITQEAARVRILRRYFQNQLVATVPSIHRLFRWSKQDVYRSLGVLVGDGVIAPNATVKDQPGRFYCLIERE